MMRKCENCGSKFKVGHLELQFFCCVNCEYEHERRMRFSRLVACATGAASGAYYQGPKGKKEKY
jgi:hypothetical protein